VEGTLLFVYGTLKRGQRNHHLIAAQQYLFSRDAQRSAHSPSTSFIVYRPAGRLARNFAASSAPRA
jgi:gamma-glutamylcyclotransferase (GGCT)/AIG2-like uncharacterized protein YtfP